MCSEKYIHNNTQCKMWSCNCAKNKHSESYTHNVIVHNWYENCKMYEKYTFKKVYPQ